MTSTNLKHWLKYTIIKNSALAIVLLLMNTIANAQWKEINSGWTGAVEHVNVSPDGSIISVQGDKYIHLFEGNTYRQLWVLKLDMKPVNSVFISNDDLLVFGTSKSLLVNLYTRNVQPFSSDIYTNGAFDSQENKLYLITSHNVLKIFSSVLGNLKLIGTRALNQKCSSISLSPTFMQLGYEKGDIEILRKSDLLLVTTLKGHKTHIYSISMDTSQTFLVSGASRDYNKGEFGEAIVWNIKTGTILFRTETRHKQVLTTHIDNRGRVFISNLYGINVYDLSGQMIGEFASGMYSNPIFCFHRGKLIYAISDIGRTSEYLYVVNAENFETEKIFSHDSRQVWALDFYKKSLVVTKDNEISIINGRYPVATYRVLSHQSEQLVKGNSIVGFEVSEMDHLTKALFLYKLEDKTSVTFPLSDDIYEKRFSSDFIQTPLGVYALTNSHLYNLSEGKTIADFSIPPVKGDSSLLDLFNEGDFFNIRSPKRKFIPNSDLFYEFDYQNQVLNIRNMETGKYLKQFKQIANVLNQDEDKLYLMNANTTRIDAFNFKTLSLESGIIGKNMLPYLNEITKLKFSDNKKVAAVKYDVYWNRISILHPGISKEIKIYPKAMHTDCFAFTPNSKYLLTGNRLGEVEIWDVFSGELKGVLFTGSLKSDYVLISGKQMDGTENGIKYFVTDPQNYQRVKGLYEMLFFR